MGDRSQESLTSRDFCRKDIIGQTAGFGSPADFESPYRQAVFDAERGTTRYNVPMKLLSLAFVTLLIVAHVLEVRSDRWTMPLSMFRDSNHPELGYGLFVLLAMIGALLSAKLIQQKQKEGVAFGLAIGLLFIAGLTPSLSPFHLLSGHIVFVILYGFYLLGMWRLKSRWLIVHALVPLPLLFINLNRNYGLLQKCLILYFVILMNVHYHRLCKSDDGTLTANAGDGQTPNGD